MNDLVTFDNGERVTTTAVIADGTRNNHASVIRLVREYKADLEEFGGVRFEIQPFETTGGMQRREIAYLNEDQSTLLITYMRNNEIVRSFKKRLIRAFRALIDASASAQPPINLDDPAFLRTALLQYTEKVIVLQQTITEQAPAVEFAKAVRNTEDSISIGDMARLLGLGQNRLFRRLREDHILMPSNRPYQQYLDRDYFRVIENVWFDAEKEPHPTFKTVVTGRGQVYLQRKYGAEAA